MDVLESRNGQKGGGGVGPAASKRALAQVVSQANHGGFFVFFLRNIQAEYKLHINQLFDEDAGSNCSRYCPRWVHLQLGYTYYTPKAATQCIENALKRRFDFN